MAIKSISELKQIEERKRKRKNSSKVKVKNQGNNHSLKRFK